MFKKKINLYFKKYMRKRSITIQKLKIKIDRLIKTSLTE
jgi:hypothetical protein